MVGRSLLKEFTENPQRRSRWKLWKVLCRSVEVFMMWRYSRQREKGLLRDQQNYPVGRRKRTPVKSCVPHKTIPKKNAHKVAMGNIRKRPYSYATAPSLTAEPQKQGKKRDRYPLMTANTPVQETLQIDIFRFLHKRNQQNPLPNNPRDHKTQRSKRPICFCLTVAILKPLRSKYFRKSDCGLRTMVVPPCPRA